MGHREVAALARQCLVRDSIAIEEENPCLVTRKINGIKKETNRANGIVYIVVHFLVRIRHEFNLNISCRGTHMHHLLTLLGGEVLQVEWMGSKDRCR